MKVFLVGGCVRDQLLHASGIATAETDRDWVVVGATPEQMLSLGFVPVGADFPVFLHPLTHEEYALARTERKTARGYHGFHFYAAPSVTLEEDLRRRDLTINAMAQDEQGHIIDPYGGQRDIADRTLRHVSDAFAEDPVRILRLARFAARLPTFTVAESTYALARSMVQSGETDALVAERVWKELARGFSERCPRRMLEVLSDCGYWQRAFAEFELTHEQWQAIDRASAQPNHGLMCTALVFAVHQSPEHIQKRLRELRAPSESIELCTVVARCAEAALRATTPQDWAQVLHNADVLRRPERFDLFIRTLACLQPDLNVQRITQLAHAYADVPAGRIAAAQTNKADIARAIAAARTQALIDAWD